MVDRGYYTRNRPKTSGSVGHRALSQFTTQHATEYEDPSRHSPEEYLNKYGLSAYFKDVMTLVLENRPHDPIDFITEYYRNCAQGSSHLHRSYRYIRLTERNNDVFMDNLYMAYKSLSRRKGSIGATGEEMSKLLALLCHDFPPDVSSNILRRLGRRAADVVTFEEFALATKSCLLYEEFFEIAEEVFEFATVHCSPSADEDGDGGFDENSSGELGLIYTSKEISSVVDNIGGEYPDLVAFNATPYDVTMEKRWDQIQRVLNTPDSAGTFVKNAIDIDVLGNGFSISSESKTGGKSSNMSFSSKVGDAGIEKAKTSPSDVGNNSTLNKRVNARKFVKLLKDTILRISIMENSLHSSETVGSDAERSAPMSPGNSSLMFPSLKVLEQKVAAAASSHPLGNISLQEFARCVFEMTKIGEPPKKK